MTGVLVQTFIHIDGAELSCEAPTLAYRPIKSLLADSSVLTGVGVAVFPVVASLAAQLGRTLAVEIILEVDTLCSVQTGGGGAGVQVVLTLRPGEPGRAGAGEAGGCWELQTGSTVLTGLGTTGPGLGQSVALELNVGKSRQLRHLTVPVDVEGDGDVVQLDIVHAAHEAPGDLGRCVPSQLRHDVGSEVDVTLLQVEDVVQTWSRALGSLSAVQ